MIEALQLNATQLTGLLAFGGAAVACARAALMGRGRLWWVLCAASSAFAIEVVAGLRHRGHDLIDALLQAQGWYGSRGPVQVGLIAAVLLIGVWALVRLLRWRAADGCARAAVIACSVVLGLFFIEAISLHGVDTIMYAYVGPVKAIGWAWAAAALATAWAALRAAMPGREMPAVHRR